MLGKKRFFSLVMAPTGLVFVLAALHSAGQTTVAGGTLFSTTGRQLSSAAVRSTIYSVKTNAPVGANLIVNGDAEAGSGSPDGSVVSVPGWTTTRNFTAVQYGAPGFLAMDSPGPTSRGSNFFAGGPSNADSSATQWIDVSADAATIDAGDMKFTLSGYLGGNGSENDQAILTAIFVDVDSTDIGEVQIGPVGAPERSSVSGLLLRATSGTVPPDTREIQIVLHMIGTDPPYNDGYADNVSLVLNPITRTYLPSVRAQVTGNSDPVGTVQEKGG